MKRYWMALICLLLLTTASLADGVGVVILHGRWGNPNGYILGLTQQISAAGFAVEAPEMNWSLTRSYRGGLDQAEQDVNQAIDTLRQHGARKIVLIGHSIGGAFAVHYAGSHALDGLIVIVPAPYLDQPGFQRKTQDDLNRAQAMKAASQGEERAWFTDWNTNQTHKSLQMTALAYISLYDPQGPMNIAHNATRLPPGLPVLWISATREAESNRLASADAFVHVPDQANARFMEVEADHLHAPDAAVEAVLAWLRQIK